MASDMKTIYRAGSVEEAADCLDEFERNWGGSHPLSGPQLAGELGGNHPHVRVRPGGPAAAVHDQRHREPAPGLAQGGQDPGAFPQRPSGRQAAVPGPSGTLSGSGRQPPSSGVGR